ncbi:hypothetical protein Hanom_Chr04g00354161 [Helianthus anomalus]
MCYFSQCMVLQLILQLPKIINSASVNRVIVLIALVSSLLLVCIRLACYVLNFIKSYKIFLNMHSYKFFIDLNIILVYVVWVILSV